MSQTETSICRRKRRRVPLVVIGAGPHALSLVSKLLEESVDPLEETPENARLFRVVPRQRPVVGRSDGSGGEENEYAATTNIENILEKEPEHSIKTRFKGSLMPDKLARSQPYRVVRQHFEKARRLTTDRKKRLKREDIIVLDRNGTWMSQWDSQFEMLGIPHLRSGMTAHPCPVDVHTMNLHASESGRYDSGVVPVNIERTPQYHGPFLVPRTELFRNFVHEVIERYDIGEGSGVVQKATVSAVVPKIDECDCEEPACRGECVQTKIRRAKSYFEVRVNGRDEPIEAEAVVVAAGPLNMPNYPAFWNALSDQDRKLARRAGILVHATDLMYAHTSMEQKRAALQPTTRVLVIGSGLTAGHLAVRALREVTAHAPDGMVTMCARRQIQKRQFDLDLPWMGRQRSHMLCQRFWERSAVERLEVLRSAKNGGSITPEVLSVLHDFEKQGRFEAREGTEVESVIWQEGSKDAASRELPDNEGLDSYEKSILTRNGSWLVTFSTGEMEAFDTIYCATGTVLDATRDPLLKDSVAFSKECNDMPDTILLEGRLPVLDDDCRLAPGLNLFVMGQYAGLQLGPGAVNLMGGRAGAARVARALMRLNPKIGVCEYPELHEETCRCAEKGGRLGSTRDSTADTHSHSSKKRMSRRKKRKAFRRKSQKRWRASSS